MRSLPSARITSTAGTHFTDANGNFTIPGVNTPLNLTVGYSGTFTNVANQSGANYSIVFNNVQPNVPNALFGLDNVVLLPHIASGTEETRQAMADRVFDNLERFFADGTLVSAAPLP